MHALLRPLFAFLLHIGPLGLVILGILDSSFLFLPFGNDILLVVLVTRHHEYLPLYVLAASLGSANTCSMDAKPMGPLVCPVY